MSAPTPDSNIEVIIKIVATTIAGLGLIATAISVWKARTELMLKRLWEEAKVARELLQELDQNERALNATYMLGGWDGRRYKVPQEDDPDKYESHIISANEVIEALKTDLSAPTHKQIYIRDCFDNFLFHLDRMELADRNKLIKWGHLNPALITFFMGITPRLKEALQKHAGATGYEGAPGLVETLASAAASRAARRTDTRSSP